MRLPSSTDAGAATRQPSSVGRALGTHLLSDPVLCSHPCRRPQCHHHRHCCLALALVPADGGLSQVLYSPRPPSVQSMVDLGVAYQPAAAGGGDQLDRHGGGRDMALQQSDRAGHACRRRHGCGGRWSGCGDSRLCHQPPFHCHRCRRGHCRCLGLLSPSSQCRAKRRALRRRGTPRPPPWRRSWVRGLRVRKGGGSGWVKKLDK